MSNKSPNRHFSPEQVHEITEQFAISGMTCQSCATRIEKVLSKKSAIHQATVNFATEVLQISYDANQANRDEVMAWVAKAGFEAVPMADRQEQQQMPWDLIILWGLSLPFWVGMLGMIFGSHALMMPVWIQFVLASVVQVVFGARFYLGAWASIRGGLANMDVLVALGTTAIWAYSSYVWLTDLHAMHMVYFEASVMVIAFVRLGKYLEHRTKTQSLNSLGLLTQLIPTEVNRRIDGQWVKTNIDHINVGDVLLANTGDKIAVDGVVKSGFGVCNESHLTGESLLIDKHIGDMVYAGSVLSDGSIEYQAAATGAKTQLGDMMSALQDAQGTKADIARFADKVAAVFVPVVVALAMVSFLVNYLLGADFDIALMRGVAVLVIACPCALGLATPAAIMAGMGTAARHGVWFKDAVSLESAGSIDSIIFDKTGTLTLGRPSVQKIQSLSDKMSEEQALGLTASIEQYASHPLANALVEAAKDKNLPLYEVSDIQSTTGQGLIGYIDGIGWLKVGTPKFIGLASWQTEDHWMDASLVGLAVDDVPMAIFGLSDTLKADAHSIISRIHHDGIETYLMSGDRQSVVDGVANQLGITAAFGQMSPRDKLSAIETLKSQGKTVAMVGDGVNDAPAMAAAHASFAVGGATDVAKHTASARLLGESLSHVFYAYRIARMTLTNIKQNFFFALVYNCIGIPLAAIGLLNPMMAAAAMALSSISVLLNAMRLKRVQLMPREAQSDRSVS
ncbi:MULTISPECIES: heavy metal translocating P-type ATPase [Moraxella]|uniref:Lead, cadmium, zinc and mercury transporting ATPase n=1 Tax=Moraxella catarrhalis TaxID=480 RepID=A0A7Z1A4T2_MORCA|nr:cation-translocating P-type ATPase [Moraxella catarrhalis]OAV02132.1 Lead, cadmium, zinc and mercury transporting ATPase [Moraxella catarrhalis]STY81974.1 Copper-exporting P-type ATPase A [Moraxella catarrhalis]